MIKKLKTSLFKNKYLIFLKSMNLANLVLSLFLIVSIVIIIKFSNLPYLFGMPSFIKLLFKKPIENTYDFEVFNLLNMFSLTYSSSLLFYIIVDYLPNKRKQKISLILLRGNFQNIYINLEDLIYMFLLKLQIYKDCSELEELDLIGLGRIKVTKEYTYFKKSFKNSIGTHECFDFYDMGRDILTATSIINRNIDVIKKSTVVNNLSFELIKIITDIEKNNFLSQSVELLNDAPTSLIIRGNFNDNYLRLIYSYIRLRKLIFKKSQYIRSEITKDELINYKNLIDSQIASRKEILESHRYYSENNRIY